MIVLSNSKLQPIPGITDYNDTDNVKFITCIFDENKNSFLKNKYKRLIIQFLHFQMHLLISSNNTACQIHIIEQEMDNRHFAQNSLRNELISWL